MLYDRHSKLISSNLEYNVENTKLPKVVYSRSNSRGKMSVSVDIDKDDLKVTIKTTVEDKTSAFSFPLMDTPKQQKKWQKLKFNGRIYRTNGKFKYHDNQKNNDLTYWYSEFLRRGNKKQAYAIRDILLANYVGKNNSSRYNVAYKTKQLKEIEKQINEELAKANVVKSDRRLTEKQPYNLKDITVEEVKLSSKEPYQLTKKEGVELMENLIFGGKSNETVYYFDTILANYVNSIKAGKKYSRGGVIKDDIYTLQIQDIYFNPKQFTKQELDTINFLKEQQEKLNQKRLSYTRNHKQSVEKALSEGKNVPNFDFTIF